MQNMSLPLLLVIQWGANPFDVLESFDDVEAFKENLDYVIVPYHGGRSFIAIHRQCYKILQKIC